jgi:hypothetical protein
MIVWRPLIPRVRAVLTMRDKCAAVFGMTRSGVLARLNERRTEAHGKSGERQHPGCGGNGEQGVAPNIERREDPSQSGDHDRNIDELCRSGGDERLTRVP